jgi:hypothetical protein
MGFRPLLTDSNGEGGYHLRVLLCEAAPTAEVWGFLCWLTGDHGALGLPKRPECFPKQKAVTDKNPFGNWLRVPGRHHTRDHWSRIWDGSAWLDGAAAVAWLLSVEGDRPSLIPAEAAYRPTPPRAPRSYFRPGPSDNLSNRIAAYLRKLPHLGEGQGRDDIGYHFAAFLVRDLALDDDTARQWLCLWDAGNRPPKGSAEIDKWINSARQYGKRPIGCGRPAEPAPEHPRVVPGKRPGHLTLRCRVEVY